MYPVIIFFVLIVFTLFFMTRKNSHSSDLEKIQRLLRQTARWSTAAEQDSNPYIRNLHATYAVGYLLALREIYSDETILKLTGVDPRRLETEVNKVMDNAMLQVAKVCPEGQPKSEFLALLSKQGLVKE
jgi:hypothetical protein